MAWTYKKFVNKPVTFNITSRHCLGCGSLIIDSRTTYLFLSLSIWWFCFTKDWSFTLAQSVKKKWKNSQNYYCQETDNHHTRRINIARTAWVYCLKLYGSCYQQYFRNYKELLWVYYFLTKLNVFTEHCVSHQKCLVRKNLCDELFG